MTTKNSTIKVTILGDADSVKRAFGDASAAGDKFGTDVENTGGRFKSAFGGVATVAGGFLAAEGISRATGFITGAIGKATSLGEIVNKNKTIFGESFGELEAWSKTAPAALGMTQAAALNATGSLGNMFTQLGISTGQARELSKANVQLATDFASFHDADPTDVLDSISAAYRGEYDSLQKYLPLINAAAVEQEALAMTGKRTASELTAQDKALAVNALMMKGAGQAAGDFARTSDSAANRQRTLNAQIEQQQAALGQKLLPAYNAVLGLLSNQILPAITSFTAFLSEHKEVAIGLGIAIGAFVIPPMVGWAAATLAATWPFVAIGAAIAGVVTGVIYAYNHFGIFRAAIDAVGGAIGWVFNWVRSNWPLLLGILTGPIGTAAYIIMRNWDTIRDGFTAVKDWIWARVVDIYNIFGAIPSAISGFLSGLANTITWPFRNAFNLIAWLWNNTVGRLSFRVPDWVPGVGGRGWTAPQLPQLANGGIVTRPTIALIGEAGPEAVVPLNRRGGAPLVNPSNATNYNVVINVPPGANARAIGREFRRYLIESDRAGIK